MIRFIACIFAGLTFHSLAAQDLIVTRQNDSINCRITKIDSHNISYTFRHTDGHDLSTMLPLEQVNHYKRRYFSGVEAPIPGREHQHLVLSLHGGYSYRTAKVLSGVGNAMEEYLKTLKSGYNLSADLFYYISNNHGIGFRYSRFMTSAGRDNMSLPDGSGGTVFGELADDIFITFAGPMYSARWIGDDGRHSLLMNLGLGYLGYYDEACYVMDFTLEGSTAGMAIDLGYDFGLSKHLTLGILSSLYMGVLTELELSNGSTSETIELAENQYEGLGRFDINLRLSYRF